jgi:hypothetical protein
MFAGWLESFGRISLDSPTLLTHQGQLHPIAKVVVVDSHSIGRQSLTL